MYNYMLIRQDSSIQRRFYHLLNCQNISLINKLFSFISADNVWSVTVF